MASGDSLAVAASVVALAGAGVGGSRYLSGVYSRTLGSRRSLQEALHQLGPGVTTRHVDALLGPAVYSRRAEVLDEPTNILEQSFESIYFTRHAYVQIVHDEHGEVLAVGVTTIDPDFHPTLRQVPPIASGGDVYIGRTRFGELDFGPNNTLVPSEVWLHLGPYRAHYNELYNFGRSGRYMRFAFAWNEAGTGGFALNAAHEVRNVSRVNSAQLHTLPEETKLALRHFKEGTTINTVCVFADRAAVAVEQHNPWRYGLDSEATPDLLEKHRGPTRRVRDYARRTVRRWRRGHGGQRP